jgi:hypothetical protein
MGNYCHPNGPFTTKGRVDVSISFRYKDWLQYYSMTIYVNMITLNYCPNCSYVYSQFWTLCNIKANPCNGKRLKQQTLDMFMIAQA